MSKLIVPHSFFLFIFIFALVFPSCSTQEIQLPNSDDLPLRVVAQSGHSFGVSAIAVSFDNKLAASGSFDGSVKVWDIESGRELRTFIGHKEMVKSINFSHDQSKLISGDEIGSAILWDIYTGNILKQEQVMLPVVSIALDSASSFDFFKILTDSVYNNIDSVYRNIDRTNINSSYNYHFRFQNGRISFSPDLQYAVTYSGGGNKLMLWNLHTFKKIELPIVKYGPDSPIISFSSDSKNLVYTDGGETIKFYNLSTQIISSTQFYHRQLDSIKGQFTLYGLWFDNRTFKLITCEQVTNQTTSYSWICVRDSKNGRIIKTIDLGNTLVSTCSFFDDGKFILIGGSDNLISLWDVELGVRIRTFGQRNLVYHPTIEFSLNGDALLTSGFGSTAVWEKSSGRMKRTIEYQRNQSQKSPIGVMITKEEIYLSPSGNFVCQKLENGDSKILEIQTGKTYNNNIRFTFFSPDERFMFGVSKDSILQKLDIKTRKCLEFTEPLPSLNQMIIPIKKNTMFYSMVQGDSSISLWKTEPFKKIRTISKKRKFYPQISSDGTLLIESEGDNFVIRDMLTDSIIYSVTSNFDLNNERMFVNELVVSPNNKYIIALINRSDIYVWNYPSGKLLCKIQSHESTIFSIAVSPDGSQLLSANGDGTTKLLDLETGNLLATYVVGGKDIYSIVLPDNYYTASKNASAAVHFVQGLQYYTFENFDLKFNRPDIVAQRLGSSDSGLIVGLQRAYEKRLQKLSFQGSDLTNSLDVPTVAIDRSVIPLTTSDDSIRISIKANDEKNVLDRINIYDNDVALFGAKGYSLISKKIRTFEGTFSIPLSVGNNSIKLSSTNISGGESFIQSVNIVKSKTVSSKPHLYLISIGVSLFNNNEFNLSYAAKDAEDIISLFKKNQSFSGVSAFPITDSMATKEYILQCKDSLRKATVDDVVIVFIATHGLFDNALNYFLATTDINFSRPTMRGLSYESLEDLFDGIPARNRLLLIDACHSGEIDKEESELIADNTIRVNGVTSRGFKKIIDKKQSLGLQNSFSLMQNLFADLNKGTGANIISSASGKEYAYESGEWNNGVFTFSLLEGLASLSADLNNDGNVTVSELQEYVTQKVQTLTNGKQTPTSRRENIENDFKVW